MARLWQSGFELNSTTTDLELSNVTGAVTLQSTTVRTGTVALRSNPSATTGFVRFHLFTSDQSTSVFQRVYMRIAALPSGNTTIMRFVNVGNDQCSQLRLTSTGTLILLDAGSSPVGSPSAALTLDTWYCIELALDASTNPGTVAARVNGTTFASGANSAQAPWARVLIGPVVAQTCDIYWDDWAVNDASGSAQNSWPGEGKIIHLIPGGDGDTHGWSNTSNAAGSANNYQLVDEVPPNDGTDYVQTSTLNTEDMYALTDSGIGSGDTVNCVMVGARLSNNTADATATVKTQIKKTSGGTVTQGTAITPNSTTWGTNAPAQPRNYTLITYGDPDGAAWTQSTLDSAQAGVKLTAAGTNRVRITHLWVSVDYTPSSGSGATVTPSAVAAVTAVPAAAVSAGSTASPSAVAAVVAAPAPTVTATSNATAAPAVVVASAAAPAPAVSASSTLTLAAVTAATATPAPAVTASSTVGPASAAAAAGVLAATVAAGSTASPAGTTATADVPAVAVTTGSVLAPAAVAAAVDVPAPSVSASSNATTAPATVTATTTVPAPSVAAGGNATVQPAALSATVAVPAAAVSASSTVTPPAVAAAVTVPAPDASAGSTVTPAPVEGVTNIPAAAVDTDTALTPAAVTAAATVPAPTLSAGATAAPDPVTATAVVSVPSVAGHVTVQPASIAVTVTIPAPDLSTATEARPTVISVSAAMWTPTVTAHTTRDITVTAGPLSIGWASGELATGWSAGPLSA